MREICKIFIDAKKKNKYKSFIEFQHFLESIQKSDSKIRLDWYYDAGEEWARFLKNGKGIVCMMNRKIGVAFIRKNELSNRTKQILKKILIIEDADFDTQEWYIDHSLLNNIPEIVWSASPNAVDIGRMSLNDLYYATI